MPHVLTMYGATKDKVCHSHDVTENIEMIKLYSSDGNPCNLYLFSMQYMRLIIEMLPCHDHV